MNVSPAAGPVAATAEIARANAALCKAVPRIRVAPSVTHPPSRARFGVNESGRGFPAERESDSTCWLGGGQHGWSDRILRICGGAELVLWKSDIRRGKWRQFSMSAWPLSFDDVSGKDSLYA